MEKTIRIKLFLGITLLTLFLSSLLGFSFYESSISIHLEKIHANQLNKPEMSEKDISDAKEISINSASKVFVITLISTLIVTFYFANFSIRYIESIHETNAEMLQAKNKAIELARNLEFEIQNKTEECIQAKENVEMLTKAKSDLLAYMSHQIRTPMNSILAATNLLLRNQPKPEQTSNLEILKFSTENLLVIINDILDYTKIETNSIEFEKKEFNLSQLVNSMRDSFALMRGDKPLEFVVEVDERLPKKVIGDPVRLYQILNNLILNAIKFTSSGGVHLFLKLNSSTKSRVKIDFSVVDTGIGIPSHELNSIFDDFTDTKSKNKNTDVEIGVRLSISKKLLELQGSKIFVESQPDIGTNFYFGLDFDLPIEEFSSIEKEKQEIEPSLSHVKLLLVEDYKLNQMVVEEFLNIWNISVDIADNGKIAVEMADKKEYTIILMDLQMPIIDGYEATRLIRSLPNNKYKTVPIIALTASAIQETITRVKFSGMNDYITKPFKPDVLYKKIVQYTSKTS